MDEQEQEEILYRLDEKVSNIDDRMGRVEKSLQEEMADMRAEREDTKKRIKKIDHRSRRNATILNTLTLGVGAVVAKVMNLLPKIPP